MFDEPTVVPTGDKVSVEVFVNKLVIVRPLEFTDKMVTEYKPQGAEAVFADVALLDAYEGEPYKIFRRVLVMQGYLIGAFKASLGKNLLGTLYYGQRKSGQKPPYMFKSLVANPTAVKRAQEWMAVHEAEFMTQPEPSFDEPNTDGKSTLDSMRDAANPWLSDEPPF